MRPPGGGRRPLDAQEHEHRPEPRLRRAARGMRSSAEGRADLPPERVLILCTGSQGEPMSALTRIAYNDHASVEVERGDTGDHLGEAGARATSCASTTHEPARQVRRGGAAPGERARPRLRARQLRGAADAAVPAAAEGRHAGARRVPDARGACAAGAGRRGAGRVDRAGRERLGRRALARGRPHRRPDRVRRDVRRRARSGGRPGRGAPRPAAALGGRRRHHRHDARDVERRRGGGARS